MRMRCGCFLVPGSVLQRFALDASLSDASRKSFLDTSKLDPILRKLRNAQHDATLASMSLMGPVPPLAADATINPPSAQAFDCKHTQSLPGTPVANPGSSTDITVKRAYNEALGVAKFYATCFGRNSIDNHGMTLISSVHYGTNYNNAFWNGHQMTYGDGDGQIFIDFTGSNDVIGHELTHGVTQFSAGLNYGNNESGALNESISDAFGSMFRQWEANQTVAQADWLIGPGIMGPVARQRGYTCLRDMANPGAAHCLSQQPSHYSHYVPNGDPHINSGIPNKAFQLAAAKIGGKSWETAGKVWYAALTGGKIGTSGKFSTFANETRAQAKTLFRNNAAVFNAVDAAWKGVGL